MDLPQLGNKCWGRIRLAFFFFKQVGSELLCWTCPGELSCASLQLILSIVCIANLPGYQCKWMCPSASQWQGELSTFNYGCILTENLVVLNKLSRTSHHLSIIPQVPTELYWKGRGCQGICQNYIVFHLTLEVMRSFSLKCNLKVQRAFFLVSSLGNSFRGCMQLADWHISNWYREKPVPSRKRMSAEKAGQESQDMCLDCRLSA